MTIFLYLLCWAVIIILVMIGQEFEVAIFIGIMMMLFFILNELRDILRELKNK